MDKAETCDNYFISILRIPDEPNLPNLPSRTLLSIDSVAVIEQEVVDQWKLLNPSNSLSPDNISPKIIKLIIPTVFRALTQYSVCH